MVLIWEAMGRQVGAVIETEFVSEQAKKDIAEPGRMPDFLIIGAMKSGTTSFFNLLGRHPSIFVPYWKELQYFSRDHKYALGEKSYTEHFTEAKKDQIVGEGSTCYSRWPHYPHAAERIAARLPDIKLIYLMRHPVERAYSHYGHIMQERIVKKEGPILTFEEALRDDKEIIDASLYKMQIERYLELFERDQILFLTFDELVSSPDELLQQTQEFLGVEPINLAMNGEAKDNQWGDKIAKRRVKGVVDNIQSVFRFLGIKHLFPKNTRQYLKRAAINSKTLNTLFKTGVKNKKEVISPLRQITRERLLERLEESTSWIETFIDRKLPAWHI